MRNLVISLIMLMPMQQPPKQPDLYQMILKRDLQIEMLQLQIDDLKKQAESCQK